MPHDRSSNEVLKRKDRQAHKTDSRVENGSSAAEPLTGVQSDDSKQVSLRHRHPDLRRLRASFKKLKRKSYYKERPQEVSTMSKADHGSHKQSGGHIIPVSSLEILDRELGRGEFGKVLQGIWTNTQGQKTQVAVKCLSPEKVSIDKHQQDFLKEAAIMYSLNHEHLVKLFGVVLDADSSLMLVTEFAPLRSLAENIKQVALKASFPVTLVVDFCIQITDAMRYLHSSNIIHRDLSTRNILLFINEVGTKTVKISDFGLSRRLLLGENYRSEMGSKLPLAWMPVEALTKLTFTKASDVYSFGVTMWEMFSYGGRPWGTLSGEEILRAIDKPILQRLERPEACPRSIYDIMLKCWAHQSDERPTFNEIHSELPQARPLQVRAVSSHVASSPDELTYRTDDIITVIESSDQSGMWTGINPLGKIGRFECTKTSATGSGPASPTRESRKGSKIRRAKSGKTKDKEVKKSTASASAGFTKIDIGVPSNYQHIFHVGCDGQVEGDPTFGGTDYSNMPVNSGHVEKSPQTKRIARPTQLPPPPIPPPGVKAPTKASPERLEPLETASQREASPDILHGTSNSLGDRRESNHNDLVYQNGKDSPSTPDEFSSFEMGSLLEECLSAWGDSQIKLRDSLEAEESEGEAINKVNANCTTNYSTNQGQGRSREVAGGGGAAAATNDNASLSPSGGSMANSSLPDGTLNLHNTIIRDPIRTQRQTKTFVPSRRPDHQEARRKAHTLGHVTSSTPWRPLVTPATPPVSIPSSTHTSSRSRTAEATHPPPDGDVRQEKRWRADFKRLSSRTQETGTNDYLEGLDTPPLSPTEDLSGRVPVTGSSQQPRSPERRARSVKSSIKKAGYEELAKAFSPDPRTYFFQFVDQKASGSAEEDSMRKNVTLPQSMKHSENLPGKEEAVTRPPAQNLNHSQTLPSKMEAATFSPTRGMQSSQMYPPQTNMDLSPHGVTAYDMLVGGEISGSPKKSRADFGRRGPPAVPPKPNKVSYEPGDDFKRAPSDQGMGPPPRYKSTEPNSRTKPGYRESEQRDSVLEIRNVFEAPKTLEVPPVPPRDPVSPMHQVTSRLKSSVEGSISARASKSSDGWGSLGRSPSKRREENNNEGGIDDDDDSVLYHLSADTLERLEQEQLPRRRRRRSRRLSTGSNSDSSDHSPVKVATSPRSSEGARSPSPSPQRLPNLPENDQTNRPQTLHITPPLPPRSHPPPSSTHVGPSPPGLQLDPWMPHLTPPSQYLPVTSGAIPKMRSDSSHRVSGGYPSPKKDQDHQLPFGMQLDQMTSRTRLDPSGSRLTSQQTTPDIDITMHEPASCCLEQDSFVYQEETPSDPLSETLFDRWLTKNTLDSSPSQISSSMELGPGVSAAIPKTDILRDVPEYLKSTLNMLSTPTGGGEPDSSDSLYSTPQTLQDTANSWQPLTPGSSPILKPHDHSTGSPSGTGMKTSTTSLQDTVKNLRTLSPRSSPRHKASAVNELPNCYAQAEDGLDLPPPHVPIVQVKNKGGKPAVPPKPPPRGPYMKRSKTVDVLGKLGQLTGAHSGGKVKWEQNRANTVATDRDCAKRAPMKSAYFDKCIIDDEEHFLQGNHRLIRGILEMQGHSFEEVEDVLIDEEPNYPPPPVPLEEPTVMAEKHIAFRHQFVPEPPSPMSAEDRAIVLNTLERQSSVPLTLTFEDDFPSEGRHSCASSSSSATYISPRESFIGLKTSKAPPPNGMPTPIKHVTMESRGRQAHYNVPRDIPEADLCKYNIKQTPENRVRFTRDPEVRQSTGSDVVKELGYEIFVFEKSTRRSNIMDPTYEPMRSQTSSIHKVQRYINASRPSSTRVDGSVSKEANKGYSIPSTRYPITANGSMTRETNHGMGNSSTTSQASLGGPTSKEYPQGYAVMTLGGGPRQQQQSSGKKDVRRASSMNDLLGSPEECVPSSVDQDSSHQSTVCDAATDAANADWPTRPPVPPPGEGHTFGNSAPGYVRMRGSTKPRSSSVCSLFKSAKE